VGQVSETSGTKGVIGKTGLEDGQLQNVWGGGMNLGDNLGGVNLKQKQSIYKP
jgi:hypothetical protein